MALSTKMGFLREMERIHEETVIEASQIDILSTT